MTVHACLMVWVPRAWAVVDNGHVVALATDELVARRIDELIDRHGLADIPDWIEEGGE